MAAIIPRVELKESFFNQGIQDTHFFNGRLLAAKDLETLQEASRKRDVQLGQGLGAGIVYGFEVKLVANGADGKPPVLAVACGLAFNRAGQAVALPVDAEVTLAKEKPITIPDRTGFEACPPDGSGGQPLPGKGAYLLVARPTQGFTGLAPRRGFGQAAKVEGCDRDRLQEGVQFRLEELDLAQIPRLRAETRTALAELMTRTDTPSLSRLRNWLAHICIGIEDWLAFLRDPLPDQLDPFFGSALRSEYHQYGVVDALTGAGALDECDLPLALVYWQAGGVHFVDMWSVRRRLAAPSLSIPWPQPLSARRLAEAEASFQQFQDHVNDLIKRLTITTLSAAHSTEYFFYLPAAGILPLSQGAFRGFNAGVFFDQPHRPPEFIDGAALPALLQESWGYLPMPTNGDELVWVYRPWQNAKAIDDGENLQPYLVFTTGHMPPRSVARFDVARWDYSHYQKGDCL